MRSIANTGFSFGLVNVAVKMYSATEKTGPEFHQYHGGVGGCGGAIGYVRTCKDCGKEVDYHDVTKGTEVNGEIVFVSDDEFAGIERETGTSIEIEKFVPSREIDTILYNGSSYFLAPNDEKKGSVRSYMLIREVLKEEIDLVGIARYIYRGSQHTAVVRLYGKVLLLQPICFQNELREPSFPALDKEIELQPKELELARLIVASYRGEFRHSDYANEYQDRLVDFIDRKATGEVAAPKTVEDEVPTDVADLVKLLEASIKSKSAHPAGKGKGKKKETSADVVSA